MRIKGNRSAVQARAAENWNRRVAAEKQLAAQHNPKCPTGAARGTLQIKSPVSANPGDRLTEHGKRQKVSPTVKPGTQAWAPSLDRPLTTQSDRDRGNALKNGALPGMSASFGPETSHLTTAQRAERAEYARDGYGSPRWETRNGRQPRKAD